MRRVVRVSLLAVALLVPSVPAGAAERTTFRLLDASGRPLAGARVTLLGQTGSVSTGPGGLFRLDVEPPPPFELAVTTASGTWLGLVRVAVAVPGSVLDLRLPSPRTAEVEIWSTVAPSTPAPPASAAALVTREEMTERRPSRLTDTLAEMPGTSRIEEGQSVVPSVRGLARGRTLLMLDDGRVTAERRAGPSASWLNPFALENVEAVRGPGSVLYGSDAFGGVIHGRTPLPQAGGFSARYALAAGTGPEEAGIGLEANVPAGDGAVLAQFTQRSFRDYEAPSGTVDNSAARDRGGLLRLLYPVGSATLFAGVQLGEGRDMGKPAKDSNVTRAYYPREDSNRFTLGADIPGALGFSSLEIRSFLDRYVLVTDRDLLATKTTPRFLSEAYVGANDVSLRAVGRRAIGMGALRIGLEAVSRYNLHATNTFDSYDMSGTVTNVVSEVAIEDASQLDVALFGDFEQPLVAERLSLSAGLRGDAVWSKNVAGYYGDRKSTETAPSGMLALAWTPLPETSLTAQWAHGFRMPTLSDRYYRGVSGRGYVVGNPDLVPETSDQWDLAVRSRVGPAHLAAYGYYYLIHDLVERYKKGADYFFRNHGTAEIYGGELEAGFLLSPGYSLQLFGTLVRGTTREDRAPVADVPPLNGGISFDARPIAGLWIRARWALFARDDRPGPTEIVTPGYGVVDLSLGYRFLPALEARVVLNNLFNKEYPGTPDELGVPAPGFNVTFALAGRF
ncbi:MAG TPA: TonB-dependent receptor [Thermoanaerobaculia bacterium]|nr:TonB-dependent receptor [Thermoanaerobaculia bacterium]HQR66299.1 TonB-dependent receptor [Thermoanaerobaculia bacterium]